MYSRYDISYINVLDLKLLIIIYIGKYQIINMYCI